MIISAMLVSSTAAMAEMGSTGLTKSVDTTAVEEQTVNARFVKQENLKVVKVENGQIETTDENECTVYINTSDAALYKNNGTEITAEDIKEGSLITVFTKGDKAVAAIYPPVYSPDVIISVDPEYAGSVAVSKFEKNNDGPGFISEEKDLIVNLAEDAEPMDGDYIVFYSRATFSLPPQTPPDKIVKLEDKTEDDKTAEPAYVVNKGLKIVKQNDDATETVDENGETVYVNLDDAEIYDENGTELDEEQLKEGDVLSIYTPAKSPMLLIYPPVYTPAVIIRENDEYDGFVDVSTYTKTEGERSYINAEGTLVVNLPESFIENRKASNDYIVFYTVTTRSLPPQTTPEKIVVLEEKDHDDYEAEDVFEDISDDKFCDSIKKVVKAGLFKGVSDKEFSPSGHMTRAMFVTVLGRLDGIAVKDACVTGFEDTPGNEYYSSYVAWANENGIVRGYEDKTFKPNQQVSREEALQIIYNYCKYKGIGPEGAWAVNIDYEDADEISDTASEACMWNEINNYLLPESKNGKLKPKQKASRAEVAHALDVLMDQLNK